MNVEAHQLANAQAAAVQQFGHRVVARGQRGVVVGVQVRSQLHRLVHRQGLGQGFARLGRAHVLHRVVADQAFAAQPAKQPTPTGQHPRNAAGGSPGGMHARHRAANVGRLEPQQVQAGLQHLGGEALQIVGVERQCALGQALFHLHMAQVVVHVARVVGAEGGGPVHTATARQIRRRGTAATAPPPPCRRCAAKSRCPCRR